MSRFLLAIIVILALALGVQASQQALEIEQHVSAVHSAVAEAEADLALFDANHEEEAKWALLEEMEQGEPISESELAFLEMGAEQGEEMEDEAEMEDEGEMESEEEMEFYDDDALLEADSDSDADADSEADSDSELDLDVDADSTTLVVNEFPLSHEQDADPIMTESMEQDALFQEFGLLESEADTEVDADSEGELDSESESESELDSESESELDAEAESTAEVGEDGVVHTPCGKKIIWEKRTEENPEAQA